ncbi:MAG: hypothetical protein QOH90_236 [Actinomycetota bacterium]|nr:hypothetical protein [Actinomycetota bacterium]
MPKVTEAVENVRTKAVEYGVYLPVGAYARVIDGISDINRPRIRKTIVDTPPRIRQTIIDLVDVGQDRVEPVERRIRRRANSVEAQIRSTTRRTASDVSKTARKTASRAEAAVDTVAPKLPRVATPKKAADLPIKRYNSLTANEIVAESKGLTQTELAKVYKFERANENRSTVLQAIESHFTQLPIPTYDALTVAQINERIEGLSQDELKIVRRYEEDTKARTTVLEKLETLI